MDKQTAKECFERLLDEIPEKPGDESIVVLARGWIFVGKLTLADGTYTLTNARNIRKWTSGGFGGVTRGAASTGCVLDKSSDIRFKESSLIFVAPICSDWEEK